jgi:hypothetical protein
MNAQPDTVGPAASGYAPSLATRLSIKLARARRWEFWPAWLFYIPVCVYVAYLALRHRGITVFTAANPGLEGGGFVGERKAVPLRWLMENAPELAAEFELIEGLDSGTRIEQARRFVARTGGYPVVLKPDIGQRGRGVAIIRDEAMLQAWMLASNGAVLVQKYIDGAEFGLFIHRDPVTGAACLYSITHKCFPAVSGDGRSSLVQLIERDARARLIAPLLWTRFADRLNWVPAMNERVPLVEIGAHCRGSLFLDANVLASPELLGVVQRLFAAMPEYGFGRLDVRCPSPQALSLGQGIKVLEVNGVAAEAAHIYQPGTPLRTGYRSMFRQWRIAYELGAANMRRGTSATPLRELIARIREDRIRGSLWN